MQSGHHTMIMDLGAASRSSNDGGAWLYTLQGEFQSNVSLLRAHRRAVRGRPPWLLASCTAVTACDPKLLSQRAAPRPKTQYVCCTTGCMVGTGGQQNVNPSASWSMLEATAGRTLSAHRCQHRQGSGHPAPASENSCGEPRR